MTNTAELVPLLKSQGIDERRILALSAVYLDRSVFNPDPPTEKRFDLIFVGRLVPNKGLPILLEAFRLLTEHRPSAKLLIVGTGPLEGWLHGKLADPTLAGVQHRAWVELEELADLYRQSRIVVCTSCAEGGPRFVIEGMACGLPAISTPVGLMKEVIKNRTNGHLLSSWSPIELAESARTLLDEADLYTRSSSNAALVAERFEFSRTIGAYARAYLEIATSCAS